MEDSMRMALMVMAVVLLARSGVAGIKTQVVEYKHGETTLVGYLAYDDAVATEKTPRPGVVVCPEWWGNDDYAHKRAEELAKAGYVAFSIDMYGKAEGGGAKTTKDPQQAGKWAGEVNGDAKVLRGRAMAGYNALAGQKMVDKTKMAAIGYCMGGTVALELARAGADLDAVVAFHASRIAAADPADNKKLKDNGTTVLICHGQDDTFVKSEEITKFHQQMKDAKVDYEFVSYAGAVHSFTNPGADAHGMDGVKYDEKADKRSWDRMLALFREKFGTKA
jgi:dienelactone hydrolase